VRFGLLKPSTPALSSLGSLAFAIGHRQVG
jgi:hypothetical protein